MGIVVVVDTSGEDSMTTVNGKSVAGHAKGEPNSEQEEPSPLQQEGFVPQGVPERTWQHQLIGVSAAVGIEPSVADAAVQVDAAEFPAAGDIAPASATVRLSPLDGGVPLPGPAVVSEVHEI